MEENPQDLRKFAFGQAVTLLDGWEWDDADDLKDGIICLADAIYNFLTKR